MDATTFEQPTAEQISGFVSGDPIAIDEVMRIVVPQLTRWAIKQYHNLPYQEVISTVNLVCAETCKHSTRYNPTASKITTYITNLIRLRLNDVYQEWQAQQDKEEQLDKYENLLPEPYNQVIDKITQVARERFFAEVDLVLDDSERGFLRLMRQGEKNTESFVSLLPRNSRQNNDDFNEVKNAKARLIRKLQAVAMNKGYTLDDLLS